MKGTGNDAAGRRLPSGAGSASEAAPSLLGKEGTARYELGRFLGKGSFAFVHLARDARTQQQCAIKLVDITACQKREVQVGDAGEPSILAILQREVEVHATVSSSRHPNIVTLVESFRYSDPTTGSDMMAMVLEHCSRGDLQGHMKRVKDGRRQQRMAPLLPEGKFLSTNEIRHVVSQLLCGLSFLHSRGIVHRDIKTANILLCRPTHVGTETTLKKGDQPDFSLSECEIKLGDFGLAVQMNPEDDWAEAQRTFCGTPSCLAPEVVSLSVPEMKRGAKRAEVDSVLTQQLLFEEEGAGYGQPADLWSTGCLLYTMIVGRNPFALPTAHPSIEAPDPETQLLEKSKRMQQTIQRVMRCDWSVPAPIRMEKPLELLLHQLLDGQPRKRGTARGALSTHPFFRAESAEFETAVGTLANGNGTGGASEDSQRVEAETEHCDNEDITLAAPESRQQKWHEDDMASADADFANSAAEEGPQSSSLSLNNSSVPQTHKLADNQLRDTTNKRASLDNDGRMRKAYEEIARARNAAAKIGAELLDIREKRQGNPRGVLVEREGDSVAVSVDHSFSADDSDNDIMHYVLNGRAGVLKLNGYTFNRDDLEAGFRYRRRQSKDTGEEVGLEQLRSEQHCDPLWITRVKGKRGEARVPNILT